MMEHLQHECLPEWSSMSLPDDIYVAIIEHLKVRRQFAPDAYQEQCLRRRIARRVFSFPAGIADDYLAFLKKNDAELDALLSSLSIHISRFFRDPFIFRTLEMEILPDLCRQAQEAGRDILHLWSVGCATGEEPYSLALLIDELAPPGLRVSILGTDVSAQILDVARSGLYDPIRLSEVPPTVLARYFTSEKGRYRLSERVRNTVRFERHNLLDDIDFPAADLILCRNVLIYFSATEQKRIVSRFAEALQPGGVLILGGNETLVEPTGFFRAVRPGERIYRRMTGGPVS